MGDEDDGLAPLHPDALQLDVHGLAGHARRARRRARPSAAARDRGSARARARPAAACRPTAPTGSGARSRSRPTRSKQLERALPHLARARAAARRPAGARCRARCATGNSTGDWNTTPMSRRGPSIGVPSQAAPRRRTAGSRPARILSRVDFPQPDGPTIDDELAVAHGEIDVLKRHQRVGAAPEALPQMPDRNGVAVQRFPRHFARDPRRVTLFFRAGPVKQVFERTRKPSLP